MTQIDDPQLRAEVIEAFVAHLAIMPCSVDTLSSTWNPPEWEQIIEWWDTFVAEARSLTGHSYCRSKS